MSPRRCEWDAATRTPLSSSARAALMAAMDAGWADPARLYREGRQARLLLDAARESIAASLGTRADEIRFTPSSATARAHALSGLVSGRPLSSPVVLSAVEHSAVRAGAHSTGLPVVEVGVDVEGHVDVDDFVAQAANASAAALQAANGEVGTLQPVAEVCSLLAEHGVPVACDASPLVGHSPVPHGWSTASVAPETFGGPGGIGILAVRTGVRWRDPGAVEDPAWLPLAAAAAIALETSLREAAAQRDRVSGLVDRLRATLTNTIADVSAVGDSVARLPHVLTLTCMYVDGETLVRELDALGFAVTSGSACVSDSLRPSHVLAAMGVLTHGNLRIGLPWDVTDEEIDRFIAVLPGVVESARGRLGA